jgi:hypothetical protein
MQAKDCCDKVIRSERYFSLHEIPAGTSGARTLYVTCRGQAGNHAHVQPDGRAHNYQDERIHCTIHFIENDRQ